MALGAVIWRAQFEHHALGGTVPREQLEEHNARLLPWLDHEGIELAPSERELLERPLGSWEEREIGAVIWRFEAAVALLWSLGRLEEMPRYTAAVEGPAIMAHIPIGQPLPPEGDLRPEHQLERQFETAVFWNWRARNEMLRRANVSPPPGDSYLATVARAVQSALAEGLLADDEAEQGDIVVQGVRYTELDVGTYSQVASVAQERHHALSWLAGDQPWDEVDTTT